MGKEPDECFGLIGSSGSLWRFCLIKGCMVKHRGSIFAAPENHLFTWASPTEGFCAPAVGATKVSAGQMAELLTVSKTVEEWVDFLTVLETSESEVTLEELKSWLDFLDQARANCTPVKWPAASPVVFEGDLEAILEEAPQQILHASACPWSSLFPSEFAAAMEDFGHSVNGLLLAVPTALLGASIQVSEAELSLEARIEQLNVRLTLLEGMTGQCLFNSEEDLPPTLWEAVGLWSHLEASPGSDVGLGATEPKILGLLDGLDELKRATLGGAGEDSSKIGEP